MKRINEPITKEESAAALDAQAPISKEESPVRVLPGTVAENPVLPAFLPVAEPPVHYPQGESITKRQMQRIDETPGTFILTDTAEYNLALALAEANKLAFSMVDYMPVREIFENNITFFIVDAAEVEIQQLVEKTMELVPRIVLKIRDTEKPDNVFFVMFAPNQVRDKFPAIFNKYRMIGKRPEIGPCELTKGKNASRGNPPWLFRMVDQTKPFMQVYDR